MRHLTLSFRALLLPNIGLIEAIRSVISHFVQGGSDDLHRAVAQRALVILVKIENIKTEKGDIMFVAKIHLSFVLIDDICIRIDADSAHSQSKIQVLRRIFGRRIHHGKISIPQGYALIVPSYDLAHHRMELAPALRNSKEIVLGASTEVASGVIAIAQVIFSIITLYRNRGEQVEKYGYAAYSFSVFPYALMSLANLTKLVFCGRYPFMYVLRTKTLIEAEDKGGVFEGAVGVLEENPGQGDKVANNPKDDDPMADAPSWLKPISPPWFRPPGDYGNCRWIAPIIGSLILVLAIISQPIFVFHFSGFNRGQSSRAQRICMLGWLIANEVSVALAVLGNTAFDTRHPKFKWVVRMSMLPMCVFAIWGFVTVGGMLRVESYQLCNT